MVKNAIAVLLCFVFAYTVQAQNLDLDITKAINPQNPNSGYWKGTSSSAFFVGGAVPVGFLVAGIIGKDACLRQKSYEILGSLAIEFLISDPLKIAFDRKRPGEKYPGIIFPYKNLQGRSFPSGHTSLAFATAASLSIQCKKWYVTVPAYLWASSVGYSRMYLGVHYSSDVLAGAAVGIGSAYLANWLDRRLFKKKVSRQVL